jgi:hypothetical protein
MKRFTTLSIICTLSALTTSSAFAFKMPAPAIQDETQIEAFLIHFKDVPAGDRKAAIFEARAEIAKVLKTELIVGTEAAPELLKITGTDPDTKESKTSLMVAASPAASIKLFAAMKPDADEGTILKIRTTEGESGAAACAQFNSKAFAALVKKTGADEAVARDVRSMLNLVPGVVGASIGTLDSNCVVQTGT